MPELTEAVQYGDIDQIRQLLEAGADVNGQKQDLYGNEPLVLSPLEMAVEQGSIEIMDLLLEHGAEMDLRDRDGSTALHTACKQLHGIEFVDWLLKNGARVNVKNIVGKFPIDLAVRAGADGIVKVLIEHGANTASILANEHISHHMRQLVKDGMEARGKGTFIDPHDDDLIQKS